VHEISERCGIETEALLRNHGDETGARFECGIVELAITLILLEVLGVGGSEERALVMIEPPGNVRRARVLEIDDGVFVTVKLLLIKQRTGTVNESGEFKLDVTADALAIEAREQSGRRSSIKTLVVVENPDSQSIPRSFKIPARKHLAMDDSRRR